MWCICICTCIHVLYVHGVLVHAIHIVYSNIWYATCIIYFTFHVRKLAYPQSFSFAVNQWNISRKKFNFKNIIWLNGNSSTCRYYNTCINTCIYTCITEYYTNGFRHQFCYSSAQEQQDTCTLYIHVEEKVSLWLLYGDYPIIADSTNVSYWVLKLEKCNRSLMSDTTNHHFGVWFYTEVENQGYPPPDLLSPP